MDSSARAVCPNSLLQVADLTGPVGRDQARGYFAGGDRPPTRPSINKLGLVENYLLRFHVYNHLFRLR